MSAPITPREVDLVALAMERLDQISWEFDAYGAGECFFNREQAAALLKFVRYLKRRTGEPSGDSHG